MTQAVKRRFRLVMFGCLAVGGLLLFWRFVIRLALIGLILSSDCWGAWVAGPDTSDGREALAKWFPRATGDAVHAVYYFHEWGYTEGPEYMRFDTNDTTIVSEFIGRGSTGRPLHSDTTTIYGLTDHAPRWFQPPKDGRQFRDSAGFDYLWVSPDGHRVWFLFASH